MRTKAGLYECELRPTKISQGQYQDQAPCPIIQDFGKGTIALLDEVSLALG